MVSSVDMKKKKVRSSQSNLQRKGEDSLQMDKQQNI